MTGSLQGSSRWMHCSSSSEGGAEAERLDEILDRKLVIFTSLKRRLTEFRRHLRDEEVASKRVQSLPTY